ncbi:Enzymatic polyprotein [Sesamum angolense]|uniref:Enzymatic polyprotein n=1 Tax=Sesamum angolense TaxID=2727404 RepID=A0AAE2BSE0_9LAMI|nr:Enzymatic polyprotein [Sesamum angolense]
MRQDSNLSPYDGFRGIGKVLNQIGLNQRKHHIIYKERVYRNSQIFKEFAKVMAPDPIRIPRIGGVDIVIKDHPVLDRTKSSRTEFSSRMSFSEDRIMATKEKRKTCQKVLTPQEIRVNNPVVGRYEGMLEIAGHEILVTGVAGRENGSMTLEISFLEDHKPWGRKGNAYIDSGSEICTAKPGVFPKEARETLPVIAGRNFSQKILILNTGIREAKIMIGGAFGTPWFRDKRKFGKVLLSFRQQGLIDSDSIYEESKEEIENLKEAMQELKTMDISEESQLSLENVKRLIQRNFSENPLVWWDRNKIEATLKIKEECKYEYVRYKPIQMNMEDKKDMQMIIKEHINLGHIEPGISAYSSPGFLVRNHGEIKRGLVLSEKKATIAVNKIEFLGILIDETGIELQEHIVEKIRNFPDILKDKKHLQSFLGVETESAKWKWEEIHTQRVRELKQVCNNLPKLAIPQDEDELVVYTDANDYRWAAVLMKKNTTGEEPCRYTGGLFTEQQARVWHINEKEFFAVWKAFKKWPLFLLAKEFTLKVDNTNVKAFLKNKLESKIEKAHRNKNDHGGLNLTMERSTRAIRKASSSKMTNELRKHDTKHALRVQDSRPVAADSSTACTRPSPDSGVTATNESQGVQTSDDSSQPSASGAKEEEISLRPMTGTSKANTNELLSSSSAWQVYQRMWEKLISRKGVNPSNHYRDIRKIYRVWMMEGSKPEEVREWYEFGALASVHTMSPSFSKISKLPDWISGAVYDSWQNNPHLKRGDILELKFISAAPETAGKGSHPAFHFIKLQRPDMVAFNRIKAASEEAPLVSAISEDDISTRRAWGLWVCLTEMDKVKYPFKIFSNKVNGLFLLNSIMGKSTEFAESMFEKKEDAHMGEQAACN